MQQDEAEVSGTDACNLDSRDGTQASLAGRGKTLSMELPATAKDEEHLLDQVLALVAGASGHGLLAEAMLGKLPALAASGEVHELGDEGH